MTFPFPIEDLARADADIPEALLNAWTLAATGSHLHACGPLKLAAREPRIGIVGTREPDEHSLAAVEALGAHLAEQSCVIVSGAARGTDMAAHRGALSAGGGTIAFPPCGLGALNFDAWRRDFRALRDPSLLLLLSPFPMMQSVTRQTPVIRNRFIAALSEVLVVGEGRMGSGTHHCLSFARDFGTPIFFLRAGDEDAQLAAAQHSLERSGARPFTAAEALESALPREIIAAAARRRREIQASQRAQLRLFE
ncbi:hypothetical protein BH09SUM1_BH09SUM1_06190 [soil metagenome]